MNKIAIITGASRGLGKAIADLVLLQENTIVVSISRSIHKDHELFNEKRFFLIKTDMSKNFSASVFKILEKLIADGSCIFLFNNASVILPINKVGYFSEKEIANSISTNIIYPVSLINYLMGIVNNKRLSLINITSGAAKRAIAFWALYSSSKSYMEIFFNVLKEEKKGVDNFLFFSVDPGTLDTDMQHDIRSSNSPDKIYFQNLKLNNELMEPEVAARNILKEICF